MSSTYLTAADLAVINDQRARDLGVTDVFNAAPVLVKMAATTASNGTTHRYIKEVGAPTVGFRTVNGGLDNNIADDDLVSIDLSILDASYAVDKAMADAYKGGPEALLARYAKKHLRAALFAFESQIFTSTQTNGFSGLDDELDNYGHAMVVDGGSHTGSANTSVWAIRTGDDEQDAMVVLGQEGQIVIGQSVEQRLSTTDSPPKHYSGIWTPIQAWVGLQIGGSKSVGRIANLDTGSNKLTDAKLADLISRFPAGRGPTLIAMSRRSQYQLQSSRTATNSMGTEAPFPQEAFGVPIIVTDAISDTESAVAAS
jgi:hypothetical protein